MNIPTGKNFVKVQEYKVEKTVPDSPASELDKISAGPDGGSFFDSDSQQ